MQYKWYFCLRGVKSWDTLSLKSLLERQKEDVWNLADKSTQSSWNLMSLTGCEPIWSTAISIFPHGGDGQDGQAAPHCAFSTGVMKVGAAAARPISQVTTNTSIDWRCQLAGKTQGSDARCALPICLLHGNSISGDPRGYLLSYHIKCLGYGLQL